MKLPSALIIFYFVFLTSYCYANTATDLTDTCIKGVGNYAEACYSLGEMYSKGGVRIERMRYR